MSVSIVPAAGLSILRNQPLHGGAILLLDEDLDIASLRVYNETEGSDAVAVEVRAAGYSDRTTSRFHERISGLVDASKDPWNRFPGQPLPLWLSTGRR